MGRYSTGVWTVYESLRLELSFLLKKGFVRKGSVLSGTMTWTNQQGKKTGSISFESSYLGTPEGNYLELSYTLTKSSGEKVDRQYKVYLHEQDSNLGKGKVLYFLCPQSGRRCRILYSAYGSELFKARQSYQNRLYYDCQYSSKLNRYNDNYWRLEKHLEKLKKRARKGCRKHKGELTKAAQRYNRLEKKQRLMDQLRWSAAGVPKSLHKYMVGGRLRF